MHTEITTYHKLNKLKINKRIIKKILAEMLNVIVISTKQSYFIIKCNGCALLAIK